MKLILAFLLLFLVSVHCQDPPPPPEDPPKDDPPKDDPPKDEPPKDEPPKDEPPKDEPPKDEEGDFVSPLTSRKVLVPMTSRKDSKKFSKRLKHPRRCSRSKSKTCLLRVRRLLSSSRASSTEHSRLERRVMNSRRVPTTKQRRCPEVEDWLPPLSLPDDHCHHTHQFLSTDKPDSDTNQAFKFHRKGFWGFGVLGFWGFREFL